MMQHLSRMVVKPNLGNNTRTEATLQCLYRCQQASVSQVLGWAKQPRSHPDYLDNETLVTLLRFFHANNDNSSRDALIDILIQRLTRLITRMIFSKNMQLTAEDYITGIMLDIIKPTCLFYEINFTTSVSRKISKNISKASNIQSSESKNLDELSDTLEGPCDQYSEVDVTDMIALLDAPERRAMQLHYADYSAKEAASKLGITDNEYNNSLRRARRRLAKLYPNHTTNTRNISAVTE